MSHEFSTYDIYDNYNVCAYCNAVVCSARLVPGDHEYLTFTID